MDLDLGQGARPEDDFTLWKRPLCMKTFGSPWFFQRVLWFACSEVEDPYKLGLQPYFEASILFWFFRWYTGTAKIDGTRTKMYWYGQLGGVPDQSMYVVNRWSKEMFSVRIRWRKPDHMRYDNMGGI
jgi:hypothetical protein